MRFVRWLQVLAWMFVLSVIFAIPAAAQDVGEVMTESPDVARWAFLVGFIQPLALAWINRATWSRSTQSVVAFAFSVGVTVVGMAVSGELDAGLTDWVSTILAVLTASIVSYSGFWKPTGIAPKLEAATGGKPVSQAYDTGP